MLKRMSMPFIFVGLLFMSMCSITKPTMAAGVKPEEGGDDVKTSWPLCLGLGTLLQWSVQSDARPRIC